MSIEADFRALLAAYAPLTALVSTRIAQNAVPDAAGLPCVVFNASHARTHSLDASFATDECTLAVQCWAETAAVADAVADAVVAAVGTAPAARGALVLERSGGFDAELGLDGTFLAVTWWQLA